LPEEPLLLLNVARQRPVLFKGFYIRKVFAATVVVYTTGA
jgi:hypothetical protein